MSPRSWNHSLLKQGRVSSPRRPNQTRTVSLVLRTLEVSRACGCSVCATVMVSMVIMSLTSSKKIYLRYWAACFFRWLEAGKRQANRRKERRLWFTRKMLYCLLWSRTRKQTVTFSHFTPRSLLKSSTTLGMRAVMILLNSKETTEANLRWLQ